MSRNKAKVTPTFTIDPKGYTGSLYLDNNPKNLNTNGGKPFQSPPLPPQTSPNMHTLDNGSRILGSYITFNVDNNGNVGNISNPLSATAKANTLTLQTVPVGIDSGCPHYTGLIAFGTYYLLNYPTPGGPLPYLTTPTPPNKPLIHIACLKYGVDTGGLIGALSYPTLPASYFYYQVRDDGKVWSESSAGSGGSKRFFLNSGEIAIIPPTVGNPPPPLNNLVKSYQVGLYSKSYTAVGNNIPVVFGLTTFLKVTFADNSSALTYFCPDYMMSPTGTIVVNGQTFTYIITTPPAMP